MKVVDDILLNLKFSPQMVLVISNNSNALLNTLCDSIYKSYSGPKCIIESQKGLLRKIHKIQNKLVYVNVDLSKIQLSSSQNTNSLLRDFDNLKTFICESHNILILKLSLRKFNPPPRDTVPQRGWNWDREYDRFVRAIIPFENSIDRIYYIEKDGIYLSRYGDTPKYSIDQLVRYSKLKKIKRSL